MNVPETRITISIDIELLIAIQAQLMTMQKRTISKAEVMRLALAKLAEELKI